MSVAVEVGARIRAARKAHGWSQTALANKLAKQPTPTAVSYWESGDRNISLENLADVADVLGVHVSELLPERSAKLKDVYTVELKRWALGFELYIKGPGIEGMSQTSFLEDAAYMARDYIATTLDVAPDSFDVNLGPAPAVPTDSCRDALFELAYKSYVFYKDLEKTGAPETDVARQQGATTAHAMGTALVELMGEHPEGAPTSARLPRTQEVIKRLEDRYAKESGS